MLRLLLRGAGSDSGWTTEDNIAKTTLSLQSVPEVFDPVSPDPVPPTALEIDSQLGRELLCPNRRGRWRRLQ